MKCPICGAAELIHDTRDIAYAYKGEATNISAVTGDFCPACNEVILSREHGDRSVPAPSQCCLYRSCLHHKSAQKARSGSASGCRNIWRWRQCVFAL